MMSRKKPRLVIAVPRTKFACMLLASDANRVHSKDGRLHWTSLSMTDPFKYKYSSFFVNPFLSSVRSSHVIFLKIEVS